ncbi:methionyl-tRNA formyltransferase [Calycomorphotria hydatis]|uniref:Methionyl-tRNA formyltransferase n=1 Tax=Calycomorphotria hydatis TaxID=2528027 RepID=A0A517T781_9PLAN|nr:methionyl-tRNA formyltransferase [Calycomorphotria hydatis]QDT64233.1 Methionyl-tRNA formyltransferase [Calycomorphotria hydatis]
MRIIFFGSGTFGLPTLTALINSPHEVAAVVTQPDKTGRGHHRHVNPVKELASEHGCECLQPENINAEEALDSLRALDAELFLTASYGQLLKQPFLDLPPRGTINLHASLLPKYRGAAPIHYAIMNGENETGITIFQVVKKLDAGPMLGKVTTAIEPKETTGELYDRLAELAAPLALEVIERMEVGSITPEPQDAGQVSFARSLKKEQGEIDWTRSAVEIERHVRAMQPWPQAYGILQQGKEKSLRVVLTSTQIVKTATEITIAPGQLFPHDGKLFVGTGEGVLEILTLKPAGKREMTAGEFLRGHAVTGEWGFAPVG